MIYNNETVEERRYYASICTRRGLTNMHLGSLPFVLEAARKALRVIGQQLKVVAHEVSNPCQRQLWQALLEYTERLVIVEKDEAGALQAKSVLKDLNTNTKKAQIVVGEVTALDIKADMFLTGTYSCNSKLEAKLGALHTMTTPQGRLMVLDEEGLRNLSMIRHMESYFMGVSIR